MSKPKGFVYKNTQHTRVMNLKYKAKYKRLKQQIKDMIFENAALCDEVAEVQRDIIIARENRKFLAERLMRHEGYEPVNKVPKRQQKRQQPKTKAQPKQQQKKPTKQENSLLKNQVIPSIKANTFNPPNIPKKRGPKKRVIETKIIKVDKRSVRLRNEITLDANGKPIFPLNLCNVLVHSAGEIITSNPNFHTTNWIYPVGFISTRIYAHPKNPQNKCVYTCKILNNAGIPQFQIIPNNDLDSIFVGDTPSVCHQNILEALQRTLAGIVSLPLCVNGEKFFGLSNPSVIALLKLDPGYKSLKNFKGLNTGKKNKFNLPEEKDPTINFDALQSLIALSAYNTVPEIRDQPPDVLLELS
ncbi:transforming growth factor beta regulator 1 [Teleopsis dalmanni]|uniref:transforming growth factor beta regulator 1 n=1 Tax=Teleopsis dalmanni TaxID=139649 RepID=UPI0018CEBA1D|nr:transforming growth factor beta regulator 1 [Teleopsis dalmanni]